jgi:hypothetical protein
MAFSLPFLSGFDEEASLSLSLSSLSLFDFGPVFESACRALISAPNGKDFRSVSIAR